MSESLKLPPDLSAAVVKAMAVELAAVLAPQLEEVQLFTTKQVAERLQVSEPTARGLIKEHVDLGEASKRVSLKQLKQLIAKRTVPA
jgi:hypothetical protein